MNPLVSEFQEFMETNPLGVSYAKSASSKDGVMDANLLLSIKQLESKIAAEIDNKSVYGLIVSNDGSELRTTANDVRNAVILISGFKKNAQATVENLDHVLDEPTPLAGKQNLSDDEALEQFQSVTPTDSQQIGKPQIDVPNVTSSVQNRFILLSKFV